MLCYWKFHCIEWQHWNFHRVGIPLSSWHSNISRFMSTRNPTILRNEAGSSTFWTLIIDIQMLNYIWDQNFFQYRDPAFTIRAAENRSLPQFCELWWTIKIWISPIHFFWHWNGAGLSETFATIYWLSYPMSGSLVLATPKTQKMAIGQEMTSSHNKDGRLQ